MFKHLLSLKIRGNSFKQTQKQNCDSVTYLQCKIKLTADNGHKLIEQIPEACIRGAKLRGVLFEQHQPLILDPPQSIITTNGTRLATTAVQTRMKILAKKETIKKTPTMEQ